MLCVDTDVVLVVGMHINKVLYSLSYMCVTAGAAGILFVGIYLMVRFFVSLCLSHFNLFVVKFLVLVPSPCRLTCVAIDE